MYIDDIIMRSDNNLNNVIKINWKTHSTLNQRSNPSHHFLPLYTPSCTSLGRHLSSECWFCPKAMLDISETDLPGRSLKAPPDVQTTSIGRSSDSTLSLSWMTELLTLHLRAGKAIVQPLVFMMSLIWSLPTAQGHR